MYKYSINTIQDRSACTSSVNYFYYSSKVPAGTYTVETQLKRKKSICSTPKYHTGAPAAAENSTATENLVAAGTYLDGC